MRSINKDSKALCGFEMAYGHLFIPDFFISKQILKATLIDNPIGQGIEQTPICIIRKAIAL